MKYVTAELTASIVGNGSPARSWLDAEGISLIGTLGKAWEDDAPRTLGRLLKLLVVRGQHTGRQNPGAAKSCALGVAHLLPAMLRY